MKRLFTRLRQWLATLSFRTGLIVLAVCAFCYIISFAQMALPISVAAKTVLWVVFYGLAKASQYTAILILGKAGWQRVRHRLKLSRKYETQDID